MKKCKYSGSIVSIIALSLIGGYYLTLKMPDKIVSVAFFCGIVFELTKLFVRKRGLRIMLDCLVLLITLILAFCLARLCEKETEETHIELLEIMENKN